MVINIIQDLATPHNNVLIGQFKRSANAKINLWYAQDMDGSVYGWGSSIAHEHFRARIYGKSLNWRFIKYCVTHPNEKFIIVGWMNINTRLIHLLFYLIRRPFNHWTDMPNPNLRTMTLGRKLCRWAAYKVLKYSNSKVFCLGLATLNCFRKWGFPADQLVNLPIFVEVDDDIENMRTQREKLLLKYFDTSPGNFIVSAGSRLVHDKGYDLLIKAIALLDEKIRPHIKVVIVGSGECLSHLQKLVIDLCLESQVVFEKWLSIGDFKTLIANSDVFIHPARFDSYGGTTLGMALCVPVIGSYNAGAAFDRIEQGRNGFLYDAEDIKTLANFITLLYRNPKLKNHMAQEALQTARQWHPQRGVDILLQNMI